MPNPGKARNAGVLWPILAKPEILENYAQSWRSQEYQRFIPNPDEARNIRDLGLILAKPGMLEFYSQSWRSREH
jgi:hypothetical protein